MSLSLYILSRMSDLISDYFIYYGHISRPSEDFVMRLILPAVIECMQTFGEKVDSKVFEFMEDHHG